MEVGMEHAFENRLRDLVNVILYMIPCMNDELHGVNDDDLGDVPSRLVD